jgi:sialate O-acetylesterase
MVNPSRRQRFHLDAMNVFKRIAVVLICTTIDGHSVRADVGLPQVFADHMILQAEASLPIWGTASPDERVTVRLGNEKKTAVANSMGNWRVTFPPHQATTRPTTLQVRGNNEIVIEDILVGEVWLCAGQSNMEWPLKKAASGRTEVSTADHPHIRLLNLVGAARGGSGSYTAEHLARLTPELFSRGSWARCTPKTSGSFSAVGYYFGRKLHHELGVPIGLISPAIGGTPAEAWIRRAALAADDELAPLVEGNWLQNSQLDSWCQQRATANLRRARKAGEDILGDDLGPHHSFKPSFMWEAGVKPLVPYAIRGVIWYQGESNAETHWRARQHRKIFPLLVRDWRQQWGQGDFPFLYVQLPSLGRPHWPVFREGQRRVLDELPNMGMVVTMDVGHPTNVHPVKKQPVGERLACWALSETYGRKIVPSGPLFQSMRSVGNRKLLDFKHAEGGLATRDQQPPVGFEVAGEDNHFIAVEAQIENSSIVISSQEVPTITHVRYGWAAFPDPPLNLINREGLPASPFSTAPSFWETPN